MDPLILSLAFLAGLGARMVGLPPMVGFLAAGFGLNALGFSGGETVSEIADLGVTLLLFSIGLKLKIKSFLRPEIWAGTAIHMIVVTAVLGAASWGLAVAGFSLFGLLDFKAAMVLGFALSFSSTVFAVKILEDRAEAASLHGRTAVGILIMQDIAAVLFLTFTAAAAPSWTALVLIAALPLIRFVCLKIMDLIGHGELVVLFGLALALVLGAELFSLTGLKADLGALVLGVLVSTHAKADEVSKALLSFKDLFLVGFFLDIGLAGTPTLETLGLAALLLPAIAAKSALFFLLLTRFGLRARTALLSSLALTNYSEFGLIVAATAADMGWLGPEWLVVAALAVSLSFMAAAPLNSCAHSVCSRRAGLLGRFETKGRHPEETPIDPGHVEVVVIGMGRVGQGAYDLLRERRGDVVVGLDFNPDVVEENRAAGRRVLLGDATDPNFWLRLSDKRTETVTLTLLTLSHCANLTLAPLLRTREFDTSLAATARFKDQIPELLEAGVDAAFDLFADAGAGFAEHVEANLGLDAEPSGKRPMRPTPHHATS